jgi:hypothetical protein
MIKTLFATAAVLAVFTSQVSAETYDYACKVDHTPPNNGVHVYGVKINTKAKTLTWRGGVYNNLSTDTPCGKYGFFATRRDGTNALLCGMTQGVATLQIGRGPLKQDEGGDEFDCDLIRDK